MSWRRPRFRGLFHPWADVGEGRQGERQPAEVRGGERGGEGGVGVAAASFGGGEEGFDPAFTCEGAADRGAGAAGEDVPVACRAQGVGEIAELDAQGVERGAGGAAEGGKGGAEAAYGDAHLVDGFRRFACGRQAAPVEDDVGQVGGDADEGFLDRDAGLDSRGAGAAWVRGHAACDGHGFGGEAGAWDGQGKAGGEFDGQVRHVGRCASEEDTAGRAVGSDAAQGALEDRQAGRAGERGDALAAGEGGDGDEMAGNGF